MSDCEAKAELNLKAKKHIVEYHSVDVISQHMYTVCMCVFAFVFVFVCVCSAV